MSSSGAEAGATGVQAVVVTGQVGYGEDVDSGLGGGTYGGGGGDGQDRNRYRLSWWEDNVEKSTLGTDHNTPLAYAAGLEHHHPIMSRLGEPGDRLDRERERERDREKEG